MKKLNFVVSALAALVAVGCLEAQTITVDKTSLTFAALSGGTAVSQTLNVNSPTVGSQLAIFSNTTWLKVSPVSGNTPLAVTVTADPTGLTAGSYSGTLTVNSTGPVVQVPVTFAVTSIGVSPQSLTFAYTMGSPLPPSQPIILNGLPTNFTATAVTSSGGNWLEVSSSTGTSPGSITALLNSTIVPGLAAGTYTGVITLTPTSGSSSIPATVQVTLTVTAAPPVTISPSPITLNYQIGGANNQAGQPVTLATTSATVLNYAINTAVTANPAGRNWLLVNPAAGTIPANGNTQVTASYDSTANLPAGTYSGNLTFSVPGGAIANPTDAVTLLVSNNPLLNVPGATLNFTYELNGSIPPPQTVTATSTAVPANSVTGQMAIAVSATTATGGNWLSVSPSAGLVTGTPFSVVVNPAGLAPGNYTGTVAVTGSGAGNGPQTIPVALTVSNDPLLVSNAGSLSFAYQIGQSVPTSQTLNVASSNGVQLNYSATAAETTCGSSNWLILSGTTSGTVSGSASGAITVSVNPANLPAGTCTGTIVLNATNATTGAATANSPANLAITLFVSNNPVLQLSPATPISFTAQQGGAIPQPQTITLNSSNPVSPLGYTVTSTTTSGGNWIFLNSGASTAPGSNVVSISVNPGLLSAGVYSGSITINAAGVGGAAVANSPITIPIFFQVTSGNLSVSPGSLSFSQTQGLSAPAPQTVQVSGNGQALNFTAIAVSNNAINWLSVSPASGATPANLTVSVNASTLQPGTYNGTVTVSSAGAASAIVSVTFTVTSGTITVSPAALTFTQVVGGGAPAAQALVVAGTPGPINFSITGTTASGGNWLALSANAGITGSTSGAVQVSTNGTSLPVGQYTGTITISANGATVPAPVAVTLNVIPAQTITVSPAALNFSYTLGGPPPPSQTVTLASTGTATPYTISVVTAGNTGSWLFVGPPTGTAPTTLTTAIATQLLAAGNYTATISINSPNILTPVTIPVTVSVAAVPTPAITAIENAANYSSGAVSPGEIVVIFGTNFGPATLTQPTVPAGGPYPTTVANTQVLFDGVPVPIIYTQAGQLSAVVPYSVAGRPTTAVEIVYSGVTSVPLTYNVVTAAPGIFTLNAQGTGPGAILNLTATSSTVNGPSNPAAQGSFISVFMTGEGQTSPPGTTGGVAPTNGSGLNKPILPVSATVGGLPATVQYAGSAPGFIYGFAQVNVQLPTGLKTGPQPIVLTFGTGSTSFSTQAGVTVAVQ